VEHIRHQIPGQDTKPIEMVFAGSLVRFPPAPQGAQPHAIKPLILVMVIKIVSRKVLKVQLVINILHILNYEIF